MDTYNKLPNQCFLSPALQVQVDTQCDTTGGLYTFLLLFFHKNKVSGVPTQNCRTFQGKEQFKKIEKRTTRAPKVCPANHIPGADPGGGPGARAPPPTLGFEAPKLSILGPYLIFPQFFFASLRSAYYFFNMLLIHSSN